MGASCSCFMTLCGGMCYVGMAPDPLDMMLSPINKMADHIREREASDVEGATLCHADSVLVRCCNAGCVLDASCCVQSTRCSQ
jgi:hypothetical protein